MLALFNRDKSHFLSVFPDNWTPHISPICKDHYYNVWIAMFCRLTPADGTVLVYRPPKNTSSDRSAFLSELSELITPVWAMSLYTYLLEDLNCHVDSSSCTFANEFMPLLECFKFSQQVRGPTHNRSHTLDFHWFRTIMPSPSLLREAGTTAYKISRPG